MLYSYCSLIFLFSNWRNISPATHMRVKDKFTAHDLTSEVTGLYVTTESSNLAISSMDRPGVSPNLRGLSGQSFLVIYSLSRRWQVQVEVEASSLQTQILQVCTNHRTLSRKKGALISRFGSCSVNRRVGQTGWHPCTLANSHDCLPLM